MMSMISDLPPSCSRFATPKARKGRQFSRAIRPPKTAPKGPKLLPCLDWRAGRRTRRAGSFRIVVAGAFDADRARLRVSGTQNLGFRPPPPQIPCGKNPHVLLVTPNGKFCRGADLAYWRAGDASRRFGLEALDPARDSTSGPSRLMRPASLCGEGICLYHSPTRQNLRHPCQTPNPLSRELEKKRTVHRLDPPVTLSWLRWKTDKPMRPHLLSCIQESQRRVGISGH